MSETEKLAHYTNAKTHGDYDVAAGWYALMRPETQELAELSDSVRAALKRRTHP